MHPQITQISQIRFLIIGLPSGWLGARHIDQGLRIIFLSFAFFGVHSRTIEKTRSRLNTRIQPQTKKKMLD